MGCNLKNKKIILYALPTVYVWSKITPCITLIHDQHNLIQGDSFLTTYTYKDYVTK